MQKWVTAVTFAFLFTNGLTAGAVAFPVVTNTPAISVAEGATNTTIAAVIQVGGESVTNSGGYSNLSPTDLGTSKVSGPNPLNNFVYVAPSVVSTNLSDGFTYEVLLNDGTTYTVRQPITVTPINDAPIIADSTNSVSVTEDTVKLINLSEFATDEEDVSTNLTYVITDQSGVTNGTLTATGTNYLYSFTPASNVYDVVNYFTFTATDKGGLSVSGLVKISVTPASDPTVSKAAVIFIEKQGVVTNFASGTVTLSVEDADVPAGSNFNTNFTYNILPPYAPSPDWTASVSTTGLVTFTVNNTNATINTSIAVRITQENGSIPGSFVDQEVKLFFLPKNAPLWKDVSPVESDLAIFDGEKVTVAATGYDFATNSAAGSDYSLTTWGMQKVLWYVSSTPVYTTNATLVKTDTAVVLTNALSQIVSAFEFGTDSYKLVTASTNLYVIAAAYDVFGNVAYTNWKVAITSLGNQVILPVQEQYDVTVGTEFDVAVTLNTANTNLTWESDSANVVFVKQDGLKATFKALKTVAGATITVTAAAFEKYGAVDNDDITVNVKLPSSSITVTTKTLGADGQIVDDAANTVTISPIAASYAVDTQVTLTPTPVAGNVFVTWIGADATPLNNNNGVLMIEADRTKYVATAVFKQGTALLVPQIMPLGNLPAVVGVTFEQGIFVVSDNNEKTYTVTASGLPSGLVLTGSASAVDGYEISGTPKTAGTFNVTLTVKNSAGSSSVSFTITVEALPAWAVGTFNGVWVKDEHEWLPGTATYTIQANGKSSGKFLAGGKTDSDSATVIEGSEYDENGVLQSVFIHTKDNRELVVSSDGTIEVWGDDDDGHGYLSRTVSKDYDGYYTLSLAGNEECGSGYLGVTVKTTVKNGVTNGTVKVAGKLADGTAVSLSTALFDNKAVIYTAPSAYRGGYVWYMIEFATNSETQKVVHVSADEIESKGIWISYNPIATDTYTAGFRRTDLDVVGGLYTTIANIKSYYDGLTVNADNSGLAYQYNTKDLTAEAYAAEATPNGVVVNADFTVGKADKVTTTKVDGVTTYNYTTDSNADGSVNTSGLTLTLKSATGIFTGKYVTYFDYENASGKSVHTSKTVSYQGIMVPVRSDDWAEYPEGRGYYLWNRTHVETPSRTTGGAEYKYKFNESWDFQLVK
jgi:hypothetical protein